MLDAAFTAIDCYHPDWLSEAPFWRGHLPFAGVLVARLRPRRVLELGVQHGDSLFTLAEALRRYGPEGAMITGIDAWEGDSHVGAQPAWMVERVSALAKTRSNVRLIQARFKDAADRIPNGSIDLLHLDGAHDAEAVRADLELYLPKLAPEGVVLMHDITAYCRGFGVWTIWHEVAAKHPHLAFAHSAGLGLFAPFDVPAELTPWLAASCDARLALAKLFAALGQGVLLAHSTPDQIQRAMRIGRLPLPRGFVPDEGLHRALDQARW